MQELRRNNDVDWDTFNADTYRRQYFTDVGPEDPWVATEIMSFMAEQEIGESYFEQGADIGTGPSLILPLAGVVYSQKFDLIEPGAQNATYLRQVLADENQMREDWSAIEHQLSEYPDALSAQGYAARLLMERAAVRQTVISAVEPNSYDMVTSCFCAESVTADIDECADMVQAIVRSLKKGGAHAVAYIEHSQGYPDYTPEADGRIDPKKFPAVDIDKTWLERQFRGTNIAIKRCPYGQEMRDGYSGVLLAIGTK